MKKFEEELSKLETDIERQDYLIGQYVEAKDNEDRELLEQLRDYIIEGEHTVIDRAIRFDVILDRLNDVMDDIDELMPEDDEELSEEHKEKWDRAWHRYYDSLWTFKWVVGYLGQNEALPEEALEEALAIMESHYERSGFSKKGVYVAMLEQAIIGGDVSKAKQCFELWQNAETDGMSDCEACSIGTAVEYYSFVGEYDKALEEAKPLLNGEKTCHIVPQIIYPAIINSLVELGKYDRAFEIMNRADREIKKDPTLHYVATSIIENAIKIGKEDYAKELTGRYYNTILNQPNKYYHLLFFIATSKISDKSYDYAKEIAADFDLRNGNAYYSNYLAKIVGDDKDYSTKTFNF